MVSVRKSFGGCVKRSGECLKSESGWLNQSESLVSVWLVTFNESHRTHTHTRSAQGGRARLKTARPLMRLSASLRAFCQAANAPHIQNKELWPKALCANSADLRVNKKCSKIKHAKPTSAH